MPKPGDIALCQHGFAGLITCEKPTPNSADVEIWHGVHLSPLNRGKPWQSKAPRIVSNIFDAIDAAGGIERLTALYAGDLDEQPETD